MDRADVLKYLEWFHRECDSGPAHSDVIIGLQDQFEEETGTLVPERYRYRDDFEND